MSDSSGLIHVTIDGRNIAVEAKKKFYDAVQQREFMVDTTIYDAAQKLGQRAGLDRPGAGRAGSVYANAQPGHHGGAGVGAALGVHGAARGQELFAIAPDGAVPRKVERPASFVFAAGRELSEVHTLHLP